MNADPAQERSLAEIIAKLKQELTDFVSTRSELLRHELQEKAGMIKAVAPLAAMAVVFLSTAYLLFTLALISLLAVVFFAGNPYAFFFSFLIVGFVWLVIGGVAALVVKHQIHEHGIMPRKTMEVWKADKIWLRHEAKTTSEETKQEPGSTHQAA